MSTQTGRDLREAANGPLAARLSPRYLDQHCLLPLAVDDEGALVTAVGGSLDPTVSDELVRLFGRQLRLIELPAGEIQAALMAAHRPPDTSATVTAANGNAAPGTDIPAENSALDDLHALASQAPVIKLVNVLLLDALRARASDVHIESMADGLRVRFRLDGVLHDVSRLALAYQQAVVSRVKIMAGLNIAERRLPQDGRARIRLEDRDVDLRISTLPALHGESIVLRVLDQGAQARALSELGMPESIEQRFDQLIQRARGIILVTGPTGSGKTTTLYGALARINRGALKLVTVEDPVEYQIEGVTQIPVNRKAGLTFASALRSILRHDPDVIMVGEMRDRETAEIAIQAALTGHLVLSTLHTNDAPSGITRLVNMGIEPYLVAATVQGILAQRLVRLACPTCRAHATATPTCPDCAHTGFRGRTGLYELLSLNDEVRTLIVERAPLESIRAAGHRGGMTSLRHDGMHKAEAGLTTMGEVLRVISDETD